MHALVSILKENELWLMRRIRDYAVAQGYSRYTSTLEEAWRISIVGLTDSVAAALAISAEPWELRPEDEFVSDPLAEFGVLEAQKHRSRGIPLEMFMGLMKYYRQTYLDLLNLSPSGESGVVLEEGDRLTYGRFIERVFDRIEIAFCVEWGRSETMHNALRDMQDANRLITNEKNKFLTIFESLPTAVFLLDDNRRIVHMNLAGARMLDSEATGGGHYYSSPDERLPFPWLSAELEAFQHSAQESEHECQIELADGQTCQVLARFNPMEDISYKFPGTVVILKDITAAKQAELELKQMQDQMVQQEKMASVGQLAAGVAHEINNPIGFINSNLTTLQKYMSRLMEYLHAAEEKASTGGAEDHEALLSLRKKLKIDYIFDDVGEMIEECLDGSARVKGIVQDLKNFSRVEHADYTEVNLNETLETAINIAWNELKYVAKLEKDFGDIPMLGCYPQQLSQVFLNLLLNAAQAIDGEGTITMRTWQRDPESVCIAISDTGQGIPAEILPRIFEPFFTTKKIGQGTGLGLSISYGIIKRHAGDIRVESDVGNGTTFTLTLPLRCNK